MIKFLPSPPLGTRFIMEPFAGSLSYSLHYRPEAVLAADAAKELRALWRWFIEDATEADLTVIEAMRATEKIDVRTLMLPLAQETLLRLQTSGAYVGQLSSWLLYPQHSLKLDKIAAALPYIRRAVTPLYDDFADDLFETVSGDEGAFAFIDPPYLGTAGNYSRKGQDNNHMTPANVSSFVQSLRCPVLMTYGDGAAETFPEFTWQVACVRKVPILRGGGTRERTEYFAKIGNW